MDCWFGNNRLVTITRNANGNGVQVNRVAGFNGRTTLSITMSGTCANLTLTIPLIVGIPVIPAFATSGQVKQMSPGVWNGIVKIQNYRT